MAERRFAEDTKVTVAQTCLQIQALLEKKGATTFAFMENAWDIAIAFELANVRYRFVVPIPPDTAPEIVKTPQGQNRNAADRKAAREQLKKARMRALLLLLKAKLEAIAIGASTMEEELLANVVLPSGETVGQWARPQIAKSYALGSMPPMLALGPASD